MDADTAGALLVFSGMSYIIMHLALYVLFLRHRAAFHNERQIFAYHFYSGCLFTLAISGTAAILDDFHAFPAAIGMIGMHGIYSLSFLELWSLTQGSYSYQIMLRVRDSNGLTASVAEHYLAQIGESKRTDRMTVLVQMGAIEQCGKLVVCAWRGQLLARGIRLLLWLTNSGESG